MTDRLDRINMERTLGGKENYLNTAKAIINDWDIFFSEDDDFEMRERMINNIKAMFMRDFGTDDLNRVSYDAETDSFIIIIIE